MKTSHIAIGTIASLISACGGSMVSTSQYLNMLEQPTPDERARWEMLSIGNRVVVRAPAGSCSVSSADALGKLHQNATPVAGNPAYAQAQVLTISDSRVQTGSDGWIALEVQNAAGAKHWLRVPAGKPLGCIWTAPPAVDKALALRGKMLTFTPWKPTCEALHAVGPSPEATLLESDEGTPLDAGDFDIGASSALDFRAGKPGGTVWIGMNNGSIKLRADVVDNCFSPFAEGGQAVSPDVTARLHIDSARCERSDDGGKPHVECRTSIGVWEGAITAQAIALTLTRRTLGPVHFLEGKPVSGARYARAVVAVTKGTASDGRAAALYKTLDQAVSAAMQREGQGAVRVADPGASDVTYRVHVDVSNIEIGELNQSERKEIAKYKVRDDERPNPERPLAEQRVENARVALEQAESEFEREREQLEAAKQLAIEKCQELAQSMKNSQTQQIASTGCDVAQIAGRFVQPSRSGVESAQTELTTAQNNLAETPHTITVAIMADFPYTKKVFTRSTSAKLNISMRAQEAPEPTVVAIPLSVNWSDYEVEADPAHNVQGHQPNQGPLQNPEALIPFIAEQASKALALRLKAAISNAAIEQAMKAFIAAGNEPPKPGYETVDAVAFETARNRLGRVVLRGKAKLAPGGAPFVLPAKAARLAADECLLAIAVGPSGTAVDLNLLTPDGAHGDLRGASLAAVEICQTELSQRDAVEALELRSKIGGDVRWGLYRTKARTTASVEPPQAQR